MILREAPQHLLHRPLRSPASVCWLLLLCLVFPRAGDINVSMNPQLLSGAARESEAKAEEF